MTTPLARKAVGVFMFTLALCAAAVPPSWPQFRGPNSSGVAESGKPPVIFGPETNLLWKTEVEPGYSSPSIWGDRIFLTAAEGEKLLTMAVSRGNGKILWRQAVVVEKPRDIHKKNDPAAATPATDGRSVAVFYPTFGLIGYDFAGHELWRNPMAGLLARNGSGTSPAMLGNRLVLNCDVEEGKSFIAAFDPSTGKEIWRTPRLRYSSGYTTPVRWQRGDRDEVVVVGSLRVAGYNLADGRERWNIGGTEAISVVPTPVLGDGQLYVMSRSMSGTKLPPFSTLTEAVDSDGDGRISRAETPKQFVEQGMFDGVDTDRDGFITEKEWTAALAWFAQADYGIFALKPPGEGALTTNHVAWKHKKGVASISSPLFYGGRVYVAQDGGRITCMKAQRGEKLYEQERLGVDGEYYASPIAADGHIYFSSSKGTVTVAEAGDTLQVKARNALDEPIFATPAIVEDHLYVRTAQHLWAFGGK